MRLGGVSPHGFRATGIQARACWNGARRIHGQKAWLKA